MRVVILAAGEYPKAGGEGERRLKSAEFVIACDSAADEFFRHFGRRPAVTIGDLDSLKGEAPEAIRISEQDTNDLKKAIDYALKRFEAKDVVIVGATGKREDHTLGNIYRAMEEGIEVVTDYGTFYPFDKVIRLKAGKGRGISVFAATPDVKMRSRGLAWQLEGVDFKYPYVGTLNRAANDWVLIKSDGAGFVYLPDEAGYKRVVISLGSNLGNRKWYLQKAVKALNRMIETRVIDKSSVIETEGVDVPEEFKELKFLNQIVLVETRLIPLEFSRRMHAIEDNLGRVRTIRNAPRKIDIDMIAYEGVRMNSEELTLPHPRAAEREFVLRPLRELGLREAIA